MFAEKISRGQTNAEPDSARASKSRQYAVLSEARGLTKTDADMRRAFSTPSLHGGSGSTENRSMWNLAQVPVFPSAAPRYRTQFGWIQPKLMIGQSDDPLEREADHMAEQIMTAQAADVPRHSAHGVRRKCAECEKDEMEAAGTAPSAQSVRRKCTECEEEDKKLRVQQKATPGSSAGARAEAPGIVHNVLHAAGEPLAEDVRQDMEQRFAHDFSRVRVHTGSQAAESAVAIGAQAYTAGPHIVFGSGRYSPKSAQGRRLLAHELTHVIQQSGEINQKPVDDLSVQCTPEGEMPGQAGEAAPAAAGSSKVKDTSHFVPGSEIDVAEGRAFAQEAIAAMSKYGGVKVSSPPSDAIASAEAPPPGAASASAGPVPGAKSDTTVVQTFPLGYVVQRSGGGSVKPEAGFVGSIQLCYDACTGEVSVIGWLWAGGGVVTPGLLGGHGWWGAYVFVEGDILKPTKVSSLPVLKCGTCAPECKPEEKSLDWGGGISGFPVALKPGERASLKAAGLEVGALITPHLQRCDADLEIIALLDLTKYLGPLGAAVTTAEELANKLGSKFGIEIECGVGVDVSGTFHLCKSVPGGGLLGITSDSAKICGGGYVGCGVGLEHDKSALPGI